MVPVIRLVSFSQYDKMQNLDVKINNQIKVQFQLQLGAVPCCV